MHNCLNILSSPLLPGYSIISIFKPQATLLQILSIKMHWVFSWRQRQHNKSHYTKYTHNATYRHYGDSFIDGEHLPTLTHVVTMISTNDNCLCAQLVGKVGNYQNKLMKKHFTCIVTFISLVLIVLFS